MAEKPTTEKLAAALIEAGAPGWMIVNALDGYYDDFKSTIAFPEMQLLADARENNLPTIVEGVLEGRWDATAEESAAWAASAEGQAVFQELLDGSGPKDESNG